MGGGGDDEEVRIMALGYEVTVGVLLLKVEWWKLREFVALTAGIFREMRYDAEFVFGSLVWKKVQQTVIYPTEWNYTRIKIS